MKAASEHRLARALLHLSPLHRDLLHALLNGEDPGADELLARRHRTTAEFIRAERFAARQRLAEVLALLEISEG